MQRLANAIGLLALLLSLAAPAAAQTLTGSVTGTIADAQGGVLPGVTVSLAGRTGTRTAVTDEAGVYRFQAVDPGSYVLSAELAGFQPTRRENVVISVGTPLTIDLSLGVGGLQETVSVVADTQTVAVTSSEATSNLSQDILYNLPIDRSNAAVNILNNVPGVTDGSAYGGGEDGANSLMLDGVDTRDPESGSAWSFFNYNIIEEVEVKGLGAPAEYGGFTGAVVNMITKSGGNLFSGLFDITYTGESLSGDNVSEEIEELNPALGQSDVIQKLVDYTAQFGGPLARDRAFFFVSAQRYKKELDPAGPRTIRDEVSPRFNAKLTFQPNANDQITTTLQYDSYNIIGRPPSGLEYVVPDAITNREDAPEWVWLAQWRHLFGSSTFFEVKYTGYDGYFDLNPEVEASGHLDGETQEYSVSQGWFALYDRARNQVNASLSHYAEGFGRHDLKFGAELERSSVRNRYGYVGDIFFYDYGGAPYLAYQYGYDLTADNSRESFYAQDSWKLNDRLTINPGVRLDWIRGSNPEVGEVYDTKNLQPRVGFAYDVTGTNDTVIRGHYGQFYEAAFASLYNRATPGIQDFVLLEWNGSSYEEIDRIPSLLYNMDEGIKHPRVDEFTLGFERAVGPDVRFQVTGVFRSNNNFVDSVFPDARWTAITLPNARTGGTLSAYRWDNPDQSEGNALITNVDGFQYRDPAGNVIGTVDAYRRYRGLILQLNKRMANRWQANVSYVLSKAEGSVDNTFGANSGSTRVFENPSLILVNREGPLRNDRRHELKVYATYNIPVIDVNLNAIYRGLSGRNWFPYQQYSTAQTGYGISSVGRRFYLEPRGANRMPFQNSVDLRFDKQFRVSARDRISVYLDINNVLNDDTILDYQDLAPSRTITGIGPIPVGAPASLAAARQITIGGRWAF
jgi:hypothetical protein